MDIGVPNEKITTFCWGNIPYQIAICYSKNVECAFLNNKQYKPIGTIKSNNELVYTLKFSKNNNYLVAGFQTIIVIVDPKDDLNTLSIIRIDGTN